MKEKEFKTVESACDEIHDLMNELFDSEKGQKLKELLQKSCDELSEGLSLSFEYSVNVFSLEKEESVPVLQSGLNTTPGAEKPYTIYGDATPVRYICDGELSVVPGDRCPSCWGIWDFKMRNTECPDCDVVLGEEVKIVLDNDMCPNCEESKVSRKKPKCKKCGFKVDLRQVYWG